MQRARSMQLHFREFNLSKEKMRYDLLKISFHHFVKTADFNRHTEISSSTQLIRKKIYSYQKYMSHSYTAPRERGHSPPVYAWVRFLRQDKEALLLSIYCQPEREIYHITTINNSLKKYESSEVLNVCQNCCN